MSYLLLALAFLGGCVCGYVFVWGQQFLAHAHYKTTKDELDEERRKQSKTTNTKSHV